MYGKMLRLARLAGLVAIASPVGAADFDLINRTTIPAQLGSNGRSFVAHGVSDSGSYALFSSEASNLVTGDTNRAIDLFLHDGQLGTVERVNLGNGGTQADADTRQRADLSEDARYIVFESLATNLAAGDTHGTWQVYLRDRVAQTTTLISRGTGGDGGTTGSHSPQISADGRFVVFETADSLVANDDNGVRDIYRHDRTSGTLAIVSVSASGALGNQDSDDPRISADGRYVAFHTQATNLFAGDANGDGDIVLRDTIGNLNVNASIAPGGGQFGGIRELARGNAISADGRYVLFNTDMALEAADDNAAVDGFRYDRVTQQSSCVTRRPDGTVLGYGANAETLSAAGDVIVMGSRDIKLAGSSAHGSMRHYARAVPDGTIRLIKQRSGSFNPYDETTACDLSGDGNKAYCTSISDALIDGDNNAMDDLFVSAIGADGGTRLSLPLPELVSAADATSSDYANGISDDGRFVAFSSRASNLVVGDTNGVYDVFLRDRLAGTTQRISRPIYGGEAPCPSGAPRITPDGRYVVFMGCLQLAVPMWGWAPLQIYRYDRLADQLQLVSIGNNGVVCGSHCYDPSISDDGDVIVFTGATGNFGGQTAPSGGVLVRRMSDGLRALANQPPGGGVANGGPGPAKVSGDGRSVLFSDSSSNLVAGDTNGVADVFAYSLETATLTRVSLDPSGQQLAGRSRFHDVSYDGSRFVFSNVDIVCPPPGTLHLRDRISGQIVCAHEDSAAGIVFDPARFDHVALSGDGNRVAFMTPLPPYDVAPIEGIVLFDRTTKRTHRITPETLNRQAILTAMSSDGDSVLLTSGANNLVADDLNNHIVDVFVAEHLVDALFADDFETSP
jgi:Tol biopolymer transport system component